MTPPFNPGDVVEGCKRERGTFRVKRCYYSAELGQYRVVLSRGRSRPSFGFPADQFRKVNKVVPAKGWNEAFDFRQLMGARA